MEIEAFVWVMTSGSPLDDGFRGRPALKLPGAWTLSKGLGFGVLEGFSV